MSQNIAMLEEIQSVKEIVGTIDADSIEWYYDSVETILQYAKRIAISKDNKDMVSEIEYVEELTGTYDSDNPDYYDAMDIVLSYAKQHALQS